MNGKSGIYCIYCIPTGKFYIGSANNFILRFNVHNSDLNLNKHDNKYLQNAWNKYWFSSFQFHVIEYCEPSKLLEREQWWLDITSCYKRSVGYNICETAGATIGYKHSEETKKKMKKPKSLEHREKIRNTLKGIEIPPERKIRISNKLKGKKKSKEAVTNMRNSRFKKLGIKTIINF